MTETNMITSNPYDAERRAGTVGQPLPGVEVRITNQETAEPTPTGEIGMIEVRGAERLHGLLEYAGEDRRRIPRGWILHHRRPRTAGRGWLRSDRGTFEGFDHFWWLQHLPKRD